MVSNQQNIQHLLWRTGFGPTIDSDPAFNLEVEIDRIFIASKKFTPLTLTSWHPVTQVEVKKFTDAEKVAYRRMEKKARLEILEQIFFRQQNSENALREKMTLFWMGHFACRVGNPAFMLKYYNTIGEHALGKFSELLKFMIHDPALLGYLNNNINRKARPNENFSRELMELFTIGIGNYSEKDVKEGARAFTGWTYDKTGEFLVKQEHHDNGLKTYHGETGNFDGNDIIRILLARKECATFITTKIYKYFVNHTPDKNRITQLSTDFFNSDYDIDFLIKKIVSSEWFYNKENIGARIKTPLELIAGISKLFNIKFEDPLLRIPIQKVLGQSLFDPPNVAGWPEGLGWIDSSSLMYRLRLPEVLLQDAETLLAPKEEFDALETMKFQSDTNLKGKKVKTVYDASSFNMKFRNKTSQDLMNSMSEFLLQKKPSTDKYKLIDSFTSDSVGDTRILKTAIYFMSLPEYQLC